MGHGSDCGPQAPRRRFGTGRLLLWALLVSYPVVVYSFLVHVVVR